MKYDSKWRRERGWKRLWKGRVSASELLARVQTKKDRTFLWLFIATIALLAALTWLQETVIEDLVQKAEAAELTDYQAIHERYDGETREVCAKLLDV